jgi:dihydrofolate reductase
MRAIIAVNNLGFIGIGTNLLWKSTDDLKHFKKMTKGGKLLVGYNTNLGLPKLIDREVIVDYRQKNYYYNDRIDWCIGGKKTYEKYCHYFTELHISHIDDNKIGDITFPDFSNLNPECRIFNYNFKTND